MGQATFSLNSGKYLVQPVHRRQPHVSGGTLLLVLVGLSKFALPGAVTGNS